MTDAVVVKDVGKDAETEPVGPPGEFPLSLFGVSFTAKQFLGIGTLNVQTGRGELKAQSGDFVLSYADFKIVVPPYLLEKMVAESSGDNPEIIPLEKYLETHILNSKSGPDKFTEPAEEKIPAESEAPDLTATSSPASSTKSSPTTKSSLTAAKVASTKSSE